MIPSRFPSIPQRRAIGQALQVLQRWPWLETLRTLRVRFREDHLGLTAGSLTFTTVISLVPLITVMLAIFTAFPIFASFQGSLEKYFLQSLVPDSIARPVLLALTQFASKANRIGAAGLVALVVTALALMLTIDRTLNAIWRVRKPRPMAQRVLVYWATATLGPLVLGVSLSITSYAISASKGIVDALPGGVSLLLDFIEFSLMALGMASLFRFVPNTYVRWTHAIAGGVFVAIGLELAKRLFGWYLKQMPSYSAIYGAFASVPIFLVWMYLSWSIVLLGAVIAAYAPSLQMGLVRRDSQPGHRFELAIRLLRELQHARQDSGGHGRAMAQLAASLRTDPLQIEPILDHLVALDWVGRLDEEGAQRHVLLCDPARTSARPLLVSTLLDHTESVAKFWVRAGLDGMTLSDLMAR